jgi:hypothetical protein
MKSPVLSSLAFTSALATLTATLSAQIPCYDPVLGTDLALIDDSFSPVLPLGFTFTYNGVGYTDIQVCSNGYIVFGAGAPGAADFSPTVAELNTNPQARYCPMWMDFNPAIAGSGHVWSKAVPAVGPTPAHMVVTWDNVYNFGGTIPHSMQVTLVSDNRILNRYGTNLSSNTNTYIVGASPGSGAVANPVNFAVRPLLALGSAVLHQNATGAFVMAGTSIEWTSAPPGYIVNDNAACPLPTHTSYGAGCYNRPASFYELFAAGTFDLGGTSMSMLFSGGGYSVVPGITTYLAPSGGATSLALIDDSVASVALSAAMPYQGGSTASLEVCSNGFVSAAPGNLSPFTPDVVGHLGAPQASWRSWHDFNPSIVGSGAVKFEEIAGVAYITWDGVWNYLGTSAADASTMQIQFEVATGNVHFHWVSMTALGNGFLVGYSPGGPSFDPGNRDISATLAGGFSVTSTDVIALALSAAPVPALGSTVTWTISNIPATALLSVHLVSFSSIAAPGVDLGFLGAPGCNQLINTPTTNFVLFGGPSATNNITIPNNPLFAGLAIHSQGASINLPSNVLGVITSNGVTSVIN